VVEVGEEALGVVGHEAARGSLPDDLDLEAVVPEHLAGGEAVKVEDVGRVRLGHGEVGEVHLRERAVLLAPEHRAPRPR
jgi:hypothetical protein